MVSDDFTNVAGRGRAAAAKLLDIEQIPVIRLSALTPAEIKLYVLADYKLALNAGWDQEIHAGELQDPIDLGFEVEITGFSLGEIEVVLEDVADSNPKEASDSAGDGIPVVQDIAVTRAGDVWQVCRHRLVCGDARDESA